jgi:hypothetical protein
VSATTTTTREDAEECGRRVGFAAWLLCTFVARDHHDVLLIGELVCQEAPLDDQLLEVVLILFLF